MLTVLFVVVPLVVADSGSESGAASARRWNIAHTYDKIQEKGIDQALETRQSNEPRFWNDDQANAIGINKALGWEYDFCRIQWARCELPDGTGVCPYEFPILNS